MSQKSQKNSRGLNSLRHAVNKIPIATTVYAIPLFIYMFVIVILPVSLNDFKVILSTILFISSLLTSLFKKDLFISNSTFNIFLVSETVGVLWIFLGLLNKNPGTEFSLYIYVFWPIIYLFSFCGTIRSIQIYKIVRTTMMLGLGFVGLFTLYFAAYSFDLAPYTLILEIPMGQGIAKYEGYTELRLYAISSMIFLIPYTISKLIFPQLDEKRSQYFWFAIAALLGVLAMIIAGRRAGLIAIGLSPIISFILAYFVPGQLRTDAVKKFRILIFILPFFFAVLAVSPQFNILSGFENSSLTQKADSDDVRYEQADSLIKGWMQNPLFGSGLGSTTGYIRDEDRPWNYELQLHMHLFQIGIIGTFTYLFSLFWIIKRGLEISKLNRFVGSEMIALLTGFIAFAIADTTNPYWQAFGHLWTIFLPVAFINLIIISKTKSENI